MNLPLVLKAATVAIVVSGMSVGCAASRQEGWEVAPAASAGSTSEFQAARENAMSHWMQRGDSAQLRQAIAALENAYRINPTNIEVAALISRAYYLRAERDAANEDERLRLYETGTQRGEQAMSIDQRFREAMRRGTDYGEAVRGLGADYVPALYWTAVNLGRWSRAKGFTTVLANRRKVQHLVSRVSTLDSAYFHGAPDRYWGAYYSIAPGFAGGDKEKSRQHFEKSLKIAPDYIGTKVTYAETYAVGVQNRELFERLLNEASAASVTSISGIEPEQRMEQAKARGFLARANELFAK
jgi:tetratricopeptide (TPR) repeat protein